MAISEKEEFDKLNNILELNNDKKIPIFSIESSTIKKLKTFGKFKGGWVNFYLSKSRIG